MDPDGMSPLQLFWATISYGYVLFLSADMIGDGAELLLFVPSCKNLVGSVVLPILGAVPDGMMVLFSGMGDRWKAQDNVAVGVGALAGSTIMLLTWPWVLAVYGGRVDMEDGVCTGYDKGKASQRTSQKGFMDSVLHQGVRFERGVTQNAKVMLVTSLTYFLVQFPALQVDDQKTKYGGPQDKHGNSLDLKNAVTKESAAVHTWALVGTIACVVLFIIYLILQYKASADQQEAEPHGDVTGSTSTDSGAILRRVRTSISIISPAAVPEPDGEFWLQKGGTMVQYIQACRKGLRGLPYSDLTPVTGETMKLTTPMKDALSAAFNRYSTKGKIYSDAMKTALHDLGLQLPPERFAEKFKEADGDHNSYLDENEFITYFITIIKDPKPLPFEEEKEDDAAEDEDDDDEEMPEEFRDLGPAEQRRAILAQSFKSMLGGTLLVLVFSDPMVDVLGGIGTQLGISPFFVSFVLAPLASNASELISSMKLASKRTRTSITQSLQTLEGAACMNNTFCLGIFMALIYFQKLAWKFTAETFSIFLVQVLVFVVVMIGENHKLLYAIVILMFYPLSLIFVCVLEHFNYD
jgi:Ca2+/Na+ antiporter